MSLDGGASAGATSGAAAAEGAYMTDALGAAVSFAGGPGGRDARIAPLVPPLEVRGQSSEIS